MEKKNYLAPDLEMYKVLAPQAVIAVSNQATTNPVQGETDGSTWDNLY